MRCTGNTFRVQKFRVQECLLPYYITITYLYLGCFCERIFKLKLILAQIYCTHIH